MERESFQDHAIAKILNDNFVSVKVDREERPDVDRVYMGFIQVMRSWGVLDRNKLYFKNKLLQM